MGWKQHNLFVFGSGIVPKVICNHAAKYNHNSMKLAKKWMYSNHKQCFSLQKLKRFLLVPQITALLPYQLSFPENKVPQIPTHAYKRPACIIESFSTRASATAMIEMKTKSSGSRCKNWWGGKIHNWWLVNPLQTELLGQIIILNNVGHDK